MKLARKGLENKGPALNHLGSFRQRGVGNHCGHQEPEIVPDITFRPSGDSRLVDSALEFLDEGQPIVSVCLSEGFHQL